MSSEIVTLEHRAIKEKDMNLIYNKKCNDPPTDL